MSKLVIMGTIEVAPGKRDQVASLLMAHRAGCSKDEPATLQFEVALPHDDDSRILISEATRTTMPSRCIEAVPPVMQWREETAGMIVKFIATRCTPVE